jgi:hypothetical protein
MKNPLKAPFTTRFRAWHRRRGWRLEHFFIRLLGGLVAAERWQNADPGIGGLIGVRSIGRLVDGSTLEELLQREAIGRQRTLQHVPRLVRRQPGGFKSCRPFQFGLARTQLTHQHGRQTVAKGRVG